MGGSRLLLMVVVVVNIPLVISAQQVDYNLPGWNSTIGYGTTVAWPPVRGALARRGNDGVVAGCEAAPGCVAYVGISYLSQALAGGLGEAELANAAGQFALPTAAAISASVASFVSSTPPNETISMVDGPAANGYPIVNYEYAIVSARQSDPVKARAYALQDAALTAASSQATGVPLVIVAGVLAVATGFALYRAQGWLARRTHRVFNYGLVTASAALIVSLAWLVVTFAVARSSPEHGRPGGTVRLACNAAVPDNAGVGAAWRVGCRTPGAA